MSDWCPDCGNIHGRVPCSHAHLEAVTAIEYQDITGLKYAEEVVFQIRVAAEAVTTASYEETIGQSTP